MYWTGSIAYPVCVLEIVPESGATTELPFAEWLAYLMSFHLNREICMLSKKDFQDLQPRHALEWPVH